MLNQNNLQPDTISKSPHIAAFDETAESRFDTIDPGVVLTYLIDTVSASALAHLAAQFDVAGYKGYKLATTDAERRAIIKDAIILKRRMGTPWAIRQALNSAGFGSEAVIVEGVGTSGNPAVDWAVFRIEIDLGDSVGISGIIEAEATRLINEYKNARSHLDSITYKTVVTDTLTIPVDADELNLEVSVAALDDSIVHVDFYYDDTEFYDGRLSYDEPKSESLEVIIS